jgi:hypothetical protein
MRGVAKGVAAGVMSLVLAAGAAFAQQSQDSVEELKKQVSELQRKASEVDALKKRVETLENQPPTLQPSLLPAGVPVNLAEDPMPQAAPPDVTVLNTWLKDIKLSGFLDIGYTQNFNNPKAPQVNVGRSFDTASDSFMPNMMELMLERVATADSPAGLRMKIGAGKDAGVLAGTENWGGTPSDNFTVVELYAEYLAPIGKGVDFKIGKMATLAGYEVIESKDNWSYSRSLLFTWAIPLTHTGIRASYAIIDPVSASAAGPLVNLTLGIMNGWNVVVDNNTGKTLEAQIGINPTDWITAAGTIYYGDDPNGVPTVNYSKRFVFDWVTTVTRGDWKFGVNYDYGSQQHGNTTAPHDSAEWDGVAGYVRWQVTRWNAPSIRIETLRDEDGFISAGQGANPAVSIFSIANNGAPVPHVSIREFTLADEITINSNLTFRLEIRRDWATQAIFQEGRNTTKGKKSDDTLGAEAIFRF